MSSNSILYSLPFKLRLLGKKRRKGESKEGIKRKTWGGEREEERERQREKKKPTEKNISLTYNATQQNRVLLRENNQARKRLENEQLLLSPHNLSPSCC